MIILDEAKSLTREAISELSDAVEKTYLEHAGKRAERATKLRLSTEEILLRFLDTYGPDCNCRIRGVKWIGGIYYEFSHYGIRRDPMTTDPGLAMSYDLLVHMNVKPKYSFRENQGLNIVTLPAPLKPRKNAMLISIAVAILLSVLTYAVTNAVPGEARDVYILPLIANLFSKLSAVFSALATPLVFCAVITGISGIGDISSFGKIGGVFFKRMMLSYAIAMAAMLAVGLPLGIASGQLVAGGGNAFSDLSKLVLDMVPGNLIEPFVKDNDLQVIVIALFVGFVMLVLGNKVRRIRSLLDEGSALINRMMLYACKLLPVFVYLGLTNLLLSGRLEQVGQVTKTLVISLGGAAITIGVTIIRALRVTKLPFRELFSAQVPSLLINLTTSSQVSALPESMKCCKEKWRIRERFVDFGLPLGIVVYMPNGAIMLGSIVWVLTDMSSGAVDISTLVKIVLVAVVVAIAAPPIPGSGFAVMPILFSACATDMSMMPLAVIVISTVGYLLPAMNGYCLQLELLMTAWKTGNIRKEGGEEPVPAEQPE